MTRLLPGSVCAEQEYTLYNRAVQSQRCKSLIFSQRVLTCPDTSTLPTFESCVEFRFHLLLKATAEECWLSGTRSSLSKPGHNAALFLRYGGRAVKKESSVEVW